MSGKITIVSKPPKLERKKRVAAYARVSSGKDAMLHSISAQVSYYSDLIQNRLIHRPHCALQYLSYPSLPCW